MRLPGTPPASAEPQSKTLACGQGAEGSFPALRPLWQVGKRRLALCGGQDCPVRAVSASLMRLGAGVRLCYLDLTDGPTHGGRMAVLMPGLNW